MELKRADPQPASPRQLRVMTYNVHSCRGTDGKVDPVRIAEVIARHEPDIVGLQELDVGRRRTGGVDQAQAIATHLRMKFHFHPALSAAEELYGDAILTALPWRLRKASALPSTGEPRGAIWLTIDLGHRQLEVFNTHLGLWRGERMRQVQTLLGPSWVGHPDTTDKPVVLLGDFNSIPSSAAYKALAKSMDEAQEMCRPRPAATFPSWLPLVRLDHIFLRGVSVTEAWVNNDRLARMASDHLPVLATINVPQAAEEPKAGWAAANRSAVAIEPKLPI
jgi:endonuclease/exonuclease/phosphatase family metal-dependent hydrolase